MLFSVDRHVAEWIWEMLFDNSEGDILMISQSTAWCEQEGVRRIIQEKFPSIKVYYREEEPGCEVYYTNDTTGDYFPETYFLDSYDEQRYFETIEEAAESVSEIVGCTVEATIDAIQEALEKEKKRIAKKLEIDPEDLFKTKKQAYELMKVKLNQYTKKINQAKEDGEEENVPINMKDLEKIRKVAKVELWEPTVVAKNEWTTTLKTNWPLVEIIRSDEKEEIQDGSEEDDE